MSEQTAFQPQIKVSWLIGTVVVLALFAIIANYSARMTRNYTDFDQQRATERYATLKKLREEASQTLTTAAWVDQGKGIVRIPIEEAMAKEIDTLKNDTAHMCEVIPTAAPAPAPAVSTNAAPATPETPTAPAAPASIPVKPKK